MSSNSRGSLVAKALLGLVFLGAAWTVVASRLTMLLCGATGSGKTTMGKTVMSDIPPGERLITIEDTLELVISH